VPDAIAPNAAAAASFINCFMWIPLGSHQERAGYSWRDLVEGPLAPGAAVRL
jgi:hypothetical protein